MLLVESIYYGTLAQSVEHLTFNQGVGGSNPPCLILCGRGKQRHFVPRGFVHGGLRYVAEAFMLCMQWVSAAGGNAVSADTYCVKYKDILGIVPNLDKPE